MGQPDADTPTGLVRWLRLVTTAFRLSACRCHTPGQRRIGRIFLQILDKAVTIPSARGSNFHHSADRLCDRRFMSRHAKCQFIITPGATGLRRPLGSSKISPQPTALVGDRVASNVVRSVRRCPRESIEEDRILHSFLLQH